MQAVKDYASQIVKKVISNIEEIGEFPVWKILFLFRKLREK